MAWSLFGRTYRHKCPDGSVRLVYRNIDDAFPLFLPGFQTSFAASVRATELKSADLKGDYATKIDGLLYSLDELNQSLMMTFRGAYVAFTVDPCNNLNLLNRQVELILAEQRRMQLLRLQIRALIELASSHPDDRAQIMEVFHSIVQQLGGAVIAEAAREEIRDNRDRMRRWIGEG
jgi:hypothetical protein